MSTGKTRSSAPWRVASRSGNGSSRRFAADTTRTRSAPTCGTRGPRRGARGRARRDAVAVASLSLETPGRAGPGRRLRAPVKALRGGAGLCRHRGGADRRAGPRRGGPHHAEAQARAEEVRIQLDGRRPAGIRRMLANLSAAGGHAAAAPRDESRLLWSSTISRSRSSRRPRRLRIHSSPRVKGWTRR